jgi:hypothetical protein
MLHTFAAEAKCVHWESNAIQFEHILFGIFALSPAARQLIVKSSATPEDVHLTGIT